MSRRPSHENQAQVLLARASRDAAATLRSRTDRELLDLFDELWNLPATDLSLQADLPKVFSSELSRLCEVVLAKSAGGPLDPGLQEAARDSCFRAAERGSRPPQPEAEA